MAALMDITVVGTNCIHAAFNTKNSAISSLAVSLLILFLLSSSIAFIPKGVAAFDSPIIFAVKFIIIAPTAFSFFPASLNKNLIIGLNITASFSVNPLFSAIFMTPHHRHIIPTSFIIS